MAAVLAVGLCAAGCGLLPSEPTSVGQLSLTIPPQPPPATVTVQRGTVSSTVQIAGEVASTESKDLYFPVSGRLIALSVQDGQTVRDGQVLATLDSGGLLLQIQSAQLTVEQDRMNIESVQLQDESQPPTTPADARQQVLALAGAQLALAHDQQTLEQLDHSYFDTRIVAPFSGQISGLANSLGDQITAFQTVLTLSNPRREALIADLDPGSATAMHRGQLVDVTLNGITGQHVVGRVATLSIPSETEVEQVEESTGGNVIPTPECTVSLPGYRGVLPLGEPFSGLIILAEANNVLYVPSDVVRQIGGAEYVDIYKGGVEDQVRVTTGVVGDTDTAILSGLKQGEQIVQP